MSTGEVKNVSRDDIQLVQNLIERCLQLYMNQKEVVNTLLDQAKIEPGFTELVWQKLEEQNQEFFKAYHVRLMVKHQIIIFNKLLEKQVELMQKIQPAGAAALPISNGSHTFPLHQFPHCYATEHRINPSGSDNIHHPILPSTTVINGSSSMHQSMHMSDDMPHSGTMGLSSNMLLAQNPSMDMFHGMKRVAIKSEANYSNSPVFTFGGDSNVLDSRPTVGEASSASFSSGGSSSQALTGSSLEADIEFFGHISRKFSLSDLTAGFSQGSDILENYCRSPYVVTDTGDFPDSPRNEHSGENKQLDTIPEGHEL